MLAIPNRSSDSDDSKKKPLKGDYDDAKVKIRVKAPENLPAGYIFQATSLELSEPYTFDALVPNGGVKAGQVFLVQKPENFPSDMEKVRAPVGRWKDGLFDCFKLGVLHPIVWLSFCCTECALGQVMQRMRLNFCGSLLDDATPVKTFKIVFGVVLIYTICDGLFDAYEFFFVEDNAEVNEQMLYIRDLGVLIFSIWSIFIMAKTRWYLRSIYAIPEERCVGCEDIMCSVFCPCCTVSQMARHTGEYETYPSMCCTETGLPDHAPMIV